MSTLWRSSEGDLATGIILAGGKSRRMATDKAVMTVRKRPVMVDVMDVLRPLVQEILIITNQPEAYSDFDVRKFRDIIPGKGPLGGIYTGLSVSRTYSNFIVACDMPFINPHFVRHMLEVSRGFDAAVPSTRTGLEPLHAVYTKNCLGPILEHLNDGDLKVQSFFRKIHVSYIHAREIERFDSAEKMFMNMNDRQDFRRIQAIARGITES